MIANILLFGDESVLAVVAELRRIVSVEAWQQLLRHLRPVVYAGNVLEAAEFPLPGRVDVDGREANVVVPEIAVIVQKV